MVAYTGKGFKLGRKQRPCKKCGTAIQFLPTDKAPLGAWINAGDGRHHKCRDFRFAKPDFSLEISHLKSIINEEDEQQWTLIP